MSRKARALRAVHNAIGVGELACMCHLWFCAITRRRDPFLGLAVAVLSGEAIALLIWRGCPFGVLQRRAGDEVPMFELWFGPLLARFAVPALTVIAIGGLGLLTLRQPRVDRTAPWQSRRS